MKRRDFVHAGLAAAATTALPSGLLAAGTQRRASLPAELQSVSLNGGETTLSRAMLKELRDSMRGSLLFAGSDGYNTSRKIWNGMWDKHPALIARCEGAADIKSSIDFARDHDLLVAVRAGGHSIAGKSMLDGGMVIDLTAMNGVRVDPSAKTAQVEAGALLGALDQESQVYGLATTAGTVSHTGAAGLTLGGGMGRLARLHGLACDNLISVDLLTADGRLVRAGEDNNEDLLWGLRGGGGNFGIATSFEYRLHEVGPMVLGGAMMHPLDQASEALRFFADFSRNAPPELTTTAVLINPPGGKRGMCMLSVCWVGDFQQAEKVLEPLRNFGKPIADTIKPTAYTTLQKSGDRGLPHGQNYYLKSGYVQDINEALVDDLLERFTPGDSRSGVAIFNLQGGRIAGIASDATAYSHRTEMYDLIIGSSWTDAAATETNVGWGREVWKTMGEHTSGFYTNGMMEESEQRVRKNWGENYEQLLALKDQYDPRNMFRLNANIKPSS
jgi:hypothetical protein